jgi:hypothetical protein
MHETAAAGYGWNVASNTVGGTYGIAPAPGQPQSVLLRSWIARAFARAPRTGRTLVFGAWTAEERGLLGSETFAVHPLYPPGGAAQDVDLFYRIGLELANSRRWPEWNAGSEFLAIGKTSAAVRR